MTPSQAQDVEKYARDPQTWIFSAEKNMAVAKVLHDRANELRANHVDRPLAEFSGCVSASYLHAALALENAAKAVLVHRNPSQVTSTALKVKTEKSGHGIQALVSTLLPISDQADIALLKKLEEHLIWLGKYNVPNKAEMLFDEPLMDVIRLSVGDEFFRAEVILDALKKLCSVP